MTERPRFQIHLSTAVLLLLAVAVLLGLNISPRYELILSQGGDAYGWPMPFYYEAGSKERFWRFVPVGVVFDIVYSIVFGVILTNLYRRPPAFLERHTPTIFLLSIATTLFVWENIFERGWPDSWLYRDGAWSHIHVHHLAGNVSFFIIIIFLAGSACEWLWRASLRKKDVSGNP
jgi:hypothetical protein